MHERTIFGRLITKSFQSPVLLTTQPSVSCTYQDSHHLHSGVRGEAVDDINHHLHSGVRGEAVDDIKRWFEEPADGKEDMQAVTVTMGRGGGGWTLTVAVQESQDQW